MGTRSSRRPSRVALAILVVVALAGTAWAGVRRERVPPPAVERSHRALVVSGRVRALYPGSTKLMRVRVYNLEPYDLRVTRLTAQVGSGRSGCPASVLKVRPLRSRPVVPAGGSVGVRMRVRLQRAAPDSCQGVRFPIRFSAAAVRP